MLPIHMPRSLARRLAVAGNSQSTWSCTAASGCWAPTKAYTQMKLVVTRSVRKPPETTEE